MLAHHAAVPPALRNSNLLARTLPWGHDCGAQLCGGCVGEAMRSRCCCAEGVWAPRGRCALKAGMTVRSRVWPQSKGLHAELGAPVLLSSEAEAACELYARRHSWRPLLRTSAWCLCAPIAPPEA